MKLQLFHVKNTQATKIFDNGRGKLQTEHNTKNKYTTTKKYKKNET